MQQHQRLRRSVAAWADTWRKEMTCACLRRLRVAVPVRSVGFYLRVIKIINASGTHVQDTSQSVTLRSSNGAGFGFDIYGDANGAIAVQSLQSGGPAEQSGQLQPGES